MQTNSAFPPAARLRAVNRDERQGAVADLPTPSAFVIEVDGVAAGLALVGRGGYTFAASDDRFQAMDGTDFRRLDQIGRAARRLLNEAA